MVEEVTVAQRAGDKRFASSVELLEAKGGERLVRFSYSTERVEAARARHAAGT